MNSSINRISWLLVPKFVGQICYLEGCSLHILGLPLHFVEKWKQFDDAYYPKMTILKLALCVGSLTAGAVDVISQMPVNAYLNGNIFFLVHKHYESELMQKTLSSKTNQEFRGIEKTISIKHRYCLRFKYSEILEKNIMS